MLDFQRQLHTSNHLQTCNSAGQGRICLNHTGGKIPSFFLLLAEWIWTSTSESIIGSEHSCSSWSIIFAIHSHFRNTICSHSLNSDWLVLSLFSRMRTCRPRNWIRIGLYSQDNLTPACPPYILVTSVYPYNQLLQTQDQNPV